MKSLNAFLLLITQPANTFAFTVGSISGITSHSCTNLRAAPKRIGDNAEGVLYVNDKCINCSACSHFAPDIFARAPSDGYHFVHNQPSLEDDDQIDRARAALSACPVAAIRVENSAKLNHASKVAGGSGYKLSSEDEELAKNLAISPKINGRDIPFPRPLLDNVDTGVYFLGSHNDKSFGATPYLVEGRSHDGRIVSVIVDTPRFNKKSVQIVQSLLAEDSDGPDYLFLTHVDDTADHLKWREEFPSLKRIFHRGDLGKANWLGDTTLEDVEILLKGAADEGDEETFQAWNLEGDSFELKLDTEISWPDEAKGDFLVLHTPGHSPGSISLLFRSESVSTIFTGDTCAFSTRDGGRMTGMPIYCKQSLKEQSNTMKKIGKIAGLWDIIAPGHLHKREYISIPGDSKTLGLQWQAKQKDIEVVLQELARYSRY
mmetsp:Transcript_13243/g.19281  ORF Transcript_13243/g.19281 Transcript_13243/m.19281 type:complete len:431 (-) Transcript_13243:684-1976(-)